MEGSVPAPREPPTVEPPVQLVAFIYLLLKYKLAANDIQKAVVRAVQVTEEELAANQPLVDWSHAIAGHLSANLEGV